MYSPPLLALVQGQVQVPIFWRPSGLAAMTFYFVQLSTNNATHMVANKIVLFCFVSLRDRRFSERKKHNSFRYSGLSLTFTNEDPARASSI